MTDLHHLLQERLQNALVQRLHYTIQQINLYRVASAVCFGNTYPLNSDLSVGYHYLPFEQMDPGCFMLRKSAQAQLL